MEKKASHIGNGRSRFSILAAVCDLFAEQGDFDMLGATPEEIAVRCKCSSTFAHFMANCLAGRGLLLEYNPGEGGVVSYTPTRRGWRIANSVADEMFRASWPNNWREALRDVKRWVRHKRALARNRGRVTA